ncbi:protein NLRC5-like isoform X2 [Dysidea avara]|uniref:protein NLRC5-like isoform X2 n=1 Tax=Dysidea avara TaxID=196820 RepID=UPI003330B220
MKKVTVPLAVDELHDDLCFYYKRTRLTPQKNEWPPYQLKSIVNVALIHYSCGRTQQELFEISERFEQGAAAIDKLASSHFQVTKDISKIFSADPTDHSAVRSSLPPQCILIEGAPGIGKTVLAKEIVFQWASGKLLQNCKLVLLVHLRDPQLHTMTSVKELLQVYTSERVASDVNDYLEMRRGENVAFVFDGFDEFPASLQENSSITDIIEREKGIGKVFYKATVVVTSRPTTTLSLHRVIDRRIEIIGFAKEERKKYISLSFNDAHREKTQLNEYFRQHTFISDLCFIPLHLAILLFLFRMNSLPETLTEMNEYFIVHTIYRNVNRLNPSNENLVKNITDLPESVYQFLQKLSKLAFSGLQRDQLVFSYDEITKMCPEIDETPEAFNGFGLLQAVQHYAHKGAGRTTSFNFLHLTLQEFLAALHISSLSSEQQLALMVETFWDSRFKVMWMMYVGIVGTKSPPFSSFVSTYVSTFPHDPIPDGNVLNVEDSLTFSDDILNDKTKCLYLFQCYMEAKSAEIPKEISSVFINGSIELANVTILPHHISSLMFFMSASIERQWKMLELRNCDLRSVGMSSLLEHFIKNEHVASSLEYVDLSENNSSPWGVYCVIIGHCCVKGLTVCGDNGMEEHVREIIDNLEANAILKSLTLCNIGRIGLESIKEILIYNTTLDVVNLSWKKIASERINDNKNILLTAKYPQDKTTEGESVELYNNRVMDVNILYDGYHRCSHEVITLSYSNINDFAIMIITFGLCNTTSVKRLDLSCSRISDTGAATISNCLKGNNSLRELDLSLNKITIKGMQHLRESIKNVSTLEYVDLSRNGSSPWGVYCVIIRQCCMNNLTICGDDGMEEYINNIGDSLKANARLQCLTLCSIGKIGVKSLKEILTSNTTLNEVNLSWKKHSNQGLKDKKNILLSVKYRAINSMVDINVLGGDYYGPIPLEIKFSSKGDVDDDIVALLAFGLYNNTTVHTLDISHNAVSDDGAIMISKCLENNSTLINVNLSRNRISAVGAIHIGKAIETNSSLKTFDISYNKISDSGAMAFSKCLKNNNTLKELDLSLNRITKNGMEHLLESVHNKSLTVLEYLDLSGNYSSPWDVYCAVIGKCTVHKLTVCGDYDMQKYVSKLIDSLETNATLNSLTLCSIGVIGVESVKELLLRNTTLNEVNLSWEKMKSIETKKKANSLSLRKIQISLNTVSHIEDYSINSNNRVVDIRVLYNSKFSYNTVDLRNTSAFAKNALALIKFGLCDQAVFSKHAVSQSSMSDRVLTFVDVLGNSNITAKLDAVQNRFVMLEYVDLMISNTNLSPWGIYSVIIKHCCVNSLTLCGECGMEKYLEEIIDSLNANTVLESLTMCRIGRNGVESVSQILARSINLKEVNVSWEKLSNGQIQSKHNILIHSTHSCMKVVSVNIIHKCYYEILPKIVNFSNENINDDALAVIAFGLCNNTTVQRLDVSQTKISDNGAITIGNSLKKNSMMKELDMSLNKISSSGMNHIRESIKDTSAVTLEYVDLSDNIDSSPWSVYCVIIRNCCVKTISLIGDVGMDKCVSEIAESLEANKNLESITLCYIGSVGVQSIEKVLVNNVTLKELNLSWMKINSKGIKDRGNILLHTRRQFSSLDHTVSETCNFRVLDVSVLYDACCQPTPQTIDLHGESVNDDVVSVIAFGLHQNTTVQSLDISQNKLSNAGAIAISTCLKCNNTLQNLNISHNSIKDNGAIAISDCLKCNSTLQNLNISHNSIQDNGAVAISDCLKYNNTLQSLNMSNNKITSVAAQKVGEAIKSTSALQPFGI